MNKIFQELSGNITELVEYFDQNDPKMVEQSVLTQTLEQSFFLEFTFTTKFDYESLTRFYKINKKYGYTFKNNLNNKNIAVNDLVKIINNSYNEDFILDRLKELNGDDLSEVVETTNLLVLSFKVANKKVIEFLSSFEELWKDTTKNSHIETYYLKDLKLNDLFYKKTGQEDVEKYRIQCRNFLKKELDNLPKNYLDSSVQKTERFLKDMMGKEGVFSDEFKEEIIGLSLICPFLKMTNSIIKLFYDKKLSNYHPKKPLWTYFDNLQNKDVLYQFLDSFSYQNFWVDSDNKKHYKVDYLERGLKSMGVYLSENSTTSFTRQNNKQKKDSAISKAVLASLIGYWEAEVDGMLGFTREVIKEESKFKMIGKISLGDDSKKQREMLDKTLFFKNSQGEYVVLDEISYFIRNIAGFSKVLESDLLTDEEIVEVTKRYIKFRFEQKQLDLLKEKFIQREIVMDIEPTKKYVLEYSGGVNKVFLDELETVILYNKVKKNIELNNVTKEVVKTKVKKI